MKKAVVLATVVLMIAIVAASCGGSGAGGGADKIAKDELINGVTASTEKASTYRFDMHIVFNAKGTSEGEYGELNLKSDITGAFDAVDQEMQMDTTFSGSFKAGSQQEQMTGRMRTYLLGGMVYAGYQEDGGAEEWVRSDATEALRQSADLLSKNVEIVRGADVKVLGTEKVGGVTCHVAEIYPDANKLLDLMRSQVGASMPIPFAEGSISNFLCKDWYAQDTFLLIKRYQEYDLISKQGADKLTSHVTADILFYDYNKPVSISLPPETEYGSPQNTWETPSVKEIRIGVIGPMQFQMGKHHWMGATLAAEEINAAGGVKVGNDSYQIKLVQVDSNELVSPRDAASAAEKAITVDKVDFLIGTIRSEAALAVQEVAMDYQNIFIVCGSSETKMSDKVAENYDRYKYWFRVTPFNNNFLGQLNFQLVEMVAQKVSAQLQMSPKLAILAEKASWTEDIVAVAQAVLPSKGIQVVGVWQPSAQATDVTAELQAIKYSGANMIMTALSGTVGIAYGRTWEELEIPAASVGINVMAQADDFITNAGGFGNYEMTLNVYARGVEFTDKTKPFMDAFIAKMGETPTYNAGTYDAVYVLKEAIERANSLYRDDIVAEMEKTEYIATSGRLVFDSKHDVTWGPAYITGIGVQWQNGELKGVWPPAEGSWQGVKYEGIVDYQLPPWVITAWKP